MCCQVDCPEVLTDGVSIVAGEGAVLRGYRVEPLDDMYVVTRPDGSMFHIRPGDRVAVVGDELVISHPDSAVDRYLLSRHYVIARSLVDEGQGFESVPADSLLPAEAFRDRILAEAAGPRAVIDSRLSGSCECGIVTLVCRGWWEALDWQYARYPCGYAHSGYLGNGGGRPLGLGFTSNAIGFRDVPGAIGVLGLGLLGFPVGDEIIVSGAVDPGNNVMTTVRRKISSSERQLTDTTISFDPLDDVMDSGQRLGQFAVGEMVVIAGSVGNDGTYFVKRSLALGDRFEATPNGIVAEAAGALVTIEAGTSIAVETELVDEPIGADVTVLSRTQEICQEVAHDGAACDEAWLVNHVRLLVRKVGDPVDQLTVGIGYDCAVTALASIGGVALSSTFAEIDLYYDTGVLLPVGGAVTVRIGRDGGPDALNYYEVATEENASLTPARISSDGVSWGLPPAPYTVRVECFADQAVTEQAARLAASSPYVADVVVDAVRAYAVPVYRAGTRTIQEELARLIFAGEPGGSRLLVRVGCDGVVRIGKEPLGDGAAVRVLDCDGCFVGDPAVLAGNWVGGAAGAVHVGDLPLRAWLERVEMVHGKCKIRYDARGFDLARYGVIFRGE